LGTRGSALALAQSSIVAGALHKATGRTVELVEIATAGDRSGAPIASLGVGVFVSALREALTAKEIDFAVHSYKDLPTAEGAGLYIAAVPLREDPRDVLVARDGLTLTELPDGARIGTGAVRRIAQLAALGRDLECVPIRGNVDTRLRKVADGELDGVVLARAGLTRLGRAAEATEILDPMLMLPAPAQGALAVECRDDDGELRELLAALDHPGTRAAVTAERALPKSPKATTTWRSTCAVRCSVRTADSASGSRAPERPPRPSR
jgi:hydroxymethylbilane synthase